MNLYEISRDLALVLNEIGLLGGEITPEQQEKLDTLKCDLSVKVDGCVKHHRHLQLEANMVQGEIDRLKELKDQISRRADSFAEYVRRCVGSDAKIDTSIGRVWFLRTERTHVDESLRDLIPEQFRTYKTTWKPDLTAIKEAVKSGELKNAAVSIEEHFTMRLAGTKRKHRGSNEAVQLRAVEPLGLKEIGGNDPDLE